MLATTFGRYLAAVSGMLLLAAPSRGWAQTARSTDRPGARLHYELKPGVEGCPSEENMRGAVAARLGYAAFESTAPRFAVRVAIRLERELLVAELSIAPLDATGATPAVAPPPRVFRAPAGHCDELLESAAATVAMTLDPSALFGAPPREESPAAPEECPAPRTCPVCIDPELHRPPPPPTAATPVRVDAAVGGGVALLGLPRLAPQLQLEVGLRASQLRVGVAGVVTAVSETEDSSEAAAQLAYGTLSLCAEPVRRQNFRLDVCALGSAGGLTASQRNVRLETTRFTAAVGGRAQVQFVVAAPLFLRWSVDAQIPLTRHRFELGGSLRWSSPALWLGAQLTLGVQIS